MSMSMSVSEDVDVDAELCCGCTSRFSDQISDLISGLRCEGLGHRGSLRFTGEVNIPSPQLLQKGREGLSKSGTKEETRIDSGVDLKTSGQTELLLCG